MNGLRAGLVALCAAALTAGCAAGQQAQTANEHPSVDGTNGSVGQIRLLDVGLHPPAGAAFPVGSSVPMTVYIANSGHRPDTLTKISSPAFSGWNIVSTATAAAATSGTPKPPQIGANMAVGYGQTDLRPNGTGSPQTVVLTGLRHKLYPGTSVQVTFTFAHAGPATLTVPVQLSNSPNEATLPPGPPTESG